MTSPLPAYNTVVASATVLKPQKSLTPQYDSWQEQLWTYFDTIGEFESAVMWKANSLSRVRLLAAELSSSGEEPEPLTEGPAAEIMERFAGGTGGQAQLMREMVTHLSVPGEGWLVGETGDPRQGTVEGEEHWFVASADELRVATKGGTFELKTGEGRDDWRKLASNSMVVRVWQPHPRYGYQATSDARHAIGAMLELDLINKRIIAEITSRLASNGILLYDKDRLSFGQTQNTPVPDDTEKVDPFAENLVSVASRGIADAMSPEALIPIPIGYSLGELAGVDPKLLMQHIKFGDSLDPELLEQRSAAIKRLATNLDIPADVLLGLGDVNHWSAWSIEESGIKIHIAPTAELISYSLTTGYLRPMLQSQSAPLVGPRGNPVVVWYDPSEITVRPDRSESTVLAYDRLEVPGRVLRREIGLSEDADAPTPQELSEMIGRSLVRQPTTSLTALANMKSDGSVTIDGTEDVIPTSGTGGTGGTGEEGQPAAEADTGTNSIPEQSGSDAVPPAGSRLDISELGTEKLIAFAKLANDELIKRRGPVSTWVDAEEPAIDELRKPRNGSKVKAE